MKTKLKKLASSLCVLFVLSSILAGGVIVLGLWLENIVPTYEVAVVNVARAEEMPIRLYVLNAFFEAGLDVNKADRIIECESHYNENAININTNKTYDAGIFQINSIHTDISLKDKIDYKTATKWAINKVKRDKGWSAWACAGILNIK